MEPISVSRMWEYLEKQIEAGAMYGFGDKPPYSLTFKYVGRALDCSAESKELIYYGTSGKLVIPDGSIAQRIWCQEHGLNSVQYHNIGQYGQGRLFIAFFYNPNGVGHVWLVDGTKLVSMESHGHAGPSSRKWNDPVLFSIVTHCFELDCTK